MRYHALILAGRRDADDALARAARAPHRALLDVDGVPMLERVLRTLAACDRVESIRVSIDAPELLDDVPGLAELRDRGVLQVLPSESSPSRSVLAAFDAEPPDAPWLVTTADHALLDARMLGHFFAEAEHSTADVAVALVSRSVIETRFPEARRTYLKFRGESYSGANLFAFLTPKARRAAEFWLRAESLRKRPWRLVSVFGPLTLLLFLLRRLDLRAAMQRASRVIGAHIAAVEMPMAEAAVDVDKLEDLELVNRLLAEARAGGPGSATR